MTEFIGPMPEVESPKYVTPFRAVGDEIHDARDIQVATANTPGYADDNEMARVIADALNKRFEPATIAEPAPKLRTLIGFYKGDSDGEERAVTDSFAYEITPGRFVWAESRAQAEGLTGWEFPNSNYRFVDVETGETGGRPPEAKPLVESPDYDFDSYRYFRSVSGYPLLYRVVEGAGYEAPAECWYSAPNKWAPSILGMRYDKLSESSDFVRVYHA